MKELHVGQILIVSGGKYDGQGAVIKKIHDDYVECEIAGKIVRLGKDRFEVKKEPQA